MKYKASLYAKAFTDVLEKTSERGHLAIIKRFADIVRKDGDLDNFDKISREIRKILTRKDGGDFVEIELAREDHTNTGTLSSVFSKKDFVEVKIKKELLAGSRILINDEKEMDFSFQRKLRQLFS